jgi:hypothetical protein
MFDLAAPKRPAGWNYRFVHGLGAWSKEYGDVESVRLEVCENGEPKKYPVDVPIEEAAVVAGLYAEFTAKALENRGRRWEFNPSSGSR